MRNASRFLRLSLVMMFAVLALPSQAQDTRSHRRSFSSMINVDALINNYARLLARKYDLTEEQDAYTREFLRAKAHSYLDEHQDDLFNLMDHMFAVRAGDEMTQEEMMAWGQTAYPLFDEARELIEQGNMEWREILNEEQKRIHDADLELMYTSFDRTQEHLESIVSGEMTVAEFRRGPRPPSRAEKAGRPPVAARPVEPGDMADAQDRPSAADLAKQRRIAEARERLEKLRRNRAKAGRTPTDRATRRSHNTRATAPKVSENFEGEWEKYVREFTEKYDLSKSQKQRAQLILKSCRERATSYMNSRKTQIKDLDRKIKDATGDKAQAKRLEAYKKQRDRLLAPIGEIFERELKPRLERLLTAKQKAQGDSKKSMPSKRTRKSAEKDEG